MIFLLISCSFLFLYFAVPVLARDFGLNATANETGGALQQDKEIQFFIGDIIGAILAFSGVTFFLFMVIGGTVWLNAQGNEEGIKKAKDIIKGAVFGLVITLAAYGLTAFVGQILTKTK